MGIDFGSFVQIEYRDDDCETYYSVNFLAKIAKLYNSILRVQTNRLLH